MDTFVEQSLEGRLDALRCERARQDQELATSRERVATMGRAPVAVPRHMLEAIDEVCLVRLSTLTPALRG